jgi:hypothetical protein
MTRKLLAAAGCMFIVACAGGARKGIEPVAPPTASSGGAAEPQSVMRVEKKAELDRLYDDVEAQRMKMNLAEAPAFSCEGDACGMPTPMALQPHPTKATDTACKPANTDTCNTSCTLADSICTNADKICKLADELQPDNAAAAKCEKATSTCKKSHESCCACL